MDTWPDGYIELLRRYDRDYCNERNLVLKALGVDAHVVYDSGFFVLVVPAEHALRSVAELSQYDAEDKAPPEKLKPLPLKGSGLAGLGVYVACILLVAIFQNQHALSSDWLGIGALDVARVHQGEWWRLVTALTLHLDTAHLLGNLVIGGIFGFFLGRLLGDGLAWFCILLAAIMGNGMDAIVQQSYFSAAGASTAVFAALGLLCGYSWRMRNGSGLRWATRWAPLVVWCCWPGWVPVMSTPTWLPTSPALPLEPPWVRYFLRLPWFARRGPGPNGCQAYWGWSRSSPPGCLPWRADVPPCSPLAG